jgi:hypothetical protein
MQKCLYCKKTYPKLYFHVARTTPEKIYRRRKCRFCYLDTKNKLKKKSKDWIREYKNKRKCVKCGISDPRVLDFHHKGNDKEFAVSSFEHIGATLDRIKKEVEKCVVICANCHRILHHEERIRHKYK